MLPPDLDFPRAFAIAFIYLCWWLYTPLLSVFSKGTLNSQLHGVRMRWMGMLLVSDRKDRTFDAVMLGHITNSVAFFGSATLIVLAGLIGTLVNARALHIVALENKLLGEMSLGLFTIYLSVVTSILAGCFFAFVYALRKIAYTLAMIGGLSDAPGDDPNSKVMIEATATVLTEAVQSLNNGIRGYYFSVASLFLFTGPYVCMAMTLLVSSVLFYRQVFSKTARAIGEYVEAQKRIGR
jgi:uncharacterized membrane protein